jgi:N-acetylmuramoyl-L-alanine amidase
MNITDQLLTLNPFSRPGKARSQVEALVMHWTGVPNQPAMVVRNFFENRKKGKDGYGSAHYIIDPSGIILRCIPEDEVAYHVGSEQADPTSGKIYTDWARDHFGVAFCDPKTIGPNICTIGVEMCPVDSSGNYADETLASAIELAADLCKRLALNPFQDITTHHAVVGWKDCPRLWTTYPALLGAFQARVASCIATGRVA